MDLSARLRVMGDMKASGMSYAAIGRAFGVSRQCIHQLLHREQLRKPKGWVTPLRFEDVVAMRGRLRNAKTSHGHSKLALRLPEAAYILGICLTKLYDLFAAKELILIHIGRVSLVPRSDLERLIGLLAVHRVKI